MQRILIVTLLALCISGCSTIFGKNNFVTKRETEYLRTQQTAPLRLPAIVSAAGLGEDYALPPVPGPVPVTPPNIVPPDSLKAKIAAGAVPKSALKEKFVPPAAASTTSTEATADVSNSISGNASGAVVSSTNPTLQLHETTAQVWSHVGDVIPKLGYLVVNQNQNTGIYYILDMPSTHGRAEKNTPIYQLHFVNAGEGAVVTVTDNSGNAVSPVVAQRLLTNLNNGLAGNIPSPFWGKLKEILWS